MSDSPRNDELVQAAGSGDLDTVKRLIEGGADPTGRVLEAIRPTLRHLDQQYPSLAAYLAAWLPFPKLARTRNLVAFHHPVPGYPVHILIIPKQPIATINDLEAGHSDLVGKLFLAAADLADLF